jgi:hypothetical protein
MTPVTVLDIISACAATPPLADETIPIAFTMNHKEALQRRHFSTTGETFLDVDACDIDTLVVLHAEGTRICKEYLPRDSEFYFVDSVRKQASADSDFSAVMVFKGLLDVIFKIASMAAATTEVPEAFRHEGTYPWRRDWVSWLLDDGFDWDNESYWWLRIPQYRVCFDFYVTQLFRFVVLHEIGHLHNIHGPRKAALEITTVQSKSSSTDTPSEEDGHHCVHRMEFDAQTVQPSDKAVPIHAREIIADTYGFQFLIEEILLERHETLCSHLVPFNTETLQLWTEGSVAAFVTVNLYFWAMGATSKSNKMSEDNSYPSHVFRLQSIETTWMEHSLKIIPSPLVKHILTKCIQQAAESAAAITGTTHYLDWRLGLANLAYAEHYRKVCKEIPNWSNEKCRELAGRQPRPVFATQSPYSQLSKQTNYDSLLTQ